MRGQRGLGLARLLTPKEHELFPILDAGAQLVSECLNLLEELVHHHPDRAGLAAEISARADEVRNLTRTVMRRLNERFVVPIEPEDLRALAAGLDGLAGGAAEVAERLRIFGVQRAREHARRLVHLLNDAAEQTHAGVRAVRKREQLGEHARELHSAADDGERILRDGLADLFAERPEAAQLVGWSDLYEHLEEMLDAVQSIADAFDAIDAKGI